MTLNKLASALCKREGKKSQVAIGNMRETLGHLADIIYAELNSTGESAIMSAFDAAGEKRAKRKSKPRGKS